jgi:branched-chain amino acid transport system ATP-binding protein
MTTLIETHGMTAGYGPVTVLRDVDIVVRAGEVVALLGANGAGKTTTLSVLSGFLRPTAGTVDVLGRPVKGPPQAVARRGLSHVLEGRSIFPELTVRENLWLGARRSGIASVLAYFPELGALMRRKAGLLSGGEQQMLVLGRALLTCPQILLVDELSLGLAPIVVGRLLPILRRIAQQDGLGVLLVEQHAHAALAIADRAYVLDRGRIALEGPSDQVAGAVERLEASYLGADVDLPSTPHRTQARSATE